MKEQRYWTNVKNQDLANRLIGYLRRLIADFIINFDLEQEYYILTVKGNREVSKLVDRVLSKQNIQYQRLD